MKRIGIIGFGIMGESVVTSLLRHGGKYEIGILEKRGERVVFAMEKYGLIAHRNIRTLMDNSDIVIVAVKPQDISAILGEMESSFIAGEASMIVKGIISIVAGKRMEVFKKRLGVKNIARFMPNISVRVSGAPVGVSFPEGIDEGFKLDVLSIAGALGTAFEIPEDLIPAFTGLSGSGIAFVFKFIHALALGGVSSGLSYKNALHIVTAMFKGTVELLEKSGRDPVDLMHDVISPGGTTIAGITALEKSSFEYTVMDAVKSAALRAKQLEA
ncbi:MAG: pyrroline-5-carboxylate reductase [Spirochaetes bacterium]|nr:pyrroline-5-carboxylate reductase [Spirochaetota bacterium]